MCEKLKILNFTQSRHSSVEIHWYLNKQTSTYPPQLPFLFPSITLLGTPPHPIEEEEAVPSAATLMNLGMSVGMFSSKTVDDIVLRIQFKIGKCFFLQLFTVYCLESIIKLILYILPSTSISHTCRDCPLLSLTETWPAANSPQSNL